MARKRVDDPNKGGLAMRFSRFALVLLFLIDFGAPVALATNSIESLVAKARVRIKRGDLKGTLALAEKVHSLDPDSADAYFLAGSVARLTDDLDVAYKWLSKAAEIDPPRFLPELAHDLSDLAIRLSRVSPKEDERRLLLQDALWYLQQEMHPAPDPSEILLERVKVLLVLGQRDEANRLCTEHNIETDSGDAHACLRELLSVAARAGRGSAKRRVNQTAADAEGVVLPVVWWKFPPIYPELPRVARIEGRVFIEALVSCEGKVADAKVLDCTRPGLVFEEAALQAVRQWRYLPATNNGEPEDVNFTIRVDFELR
jgi:TonB family protein